MRQLFLLWIVILLNGCSILADLTLTSPSQYQVFQRSGSTGNIAIVGTIDIGGTYDIEARFNGGSWTTFLTGESGGFSGTLTSQPQGQGTLEVRLVGRSDIATVSYVGIGDIFVIAGQSNASGRGVSNQSYANGSLKAGIFKNNYTWAELADPTDSSTGQVDTVSSDTATGSPWPIVATYFLYYQNIPIAFVPAAKGGTSITAWLPGADHQDRTTLYGSMVYRALQVGGVKAVLWWQGETDAVAAMSQATYNGHLDTLANAINADLGVKLIPALLQNSSGITDADEQAIRDATSEAWGDNANVLEGPDFSDLATDDTLHFTSTAKLQTAGVRWWRALQDVFYGGATLTTYYVDFVNGNDSNNGLGPDASHASNKPWKTIAKALGASGISSGDTAYLSPAGPFREVVTVNMTSAVAETQILGDPGNVQGFKDGSGVLVAPGDVIWTAYTTNDTTAPSATSLLNLNGRDFLTFKYILFVGGSANPNCVNATTTNSVNITFRDCAFLGLTTGNCISYTGLADVASNWIIDRCYFSGQTGSYFNLTFPTSAVADYDVNFLIQNCVVRGAIESRFASATTSGALSFKPGGVDLFNITMISRGSLFGTVSANMSTSIPCTIYNSFMVTGGAVALNANASGQIVEDNNRILAVTPRTNVTAGASSISDNSHAILHEFGQAEMFGRVQHPFGMPSASSPLLGRGATAGGPTVDILNRPRPAGGGSTSYAWGAYERHDTAAKETSVVDAGSNAVKITGPGDHDLFIPVDASSTTITVRVRYDTNHATTNKPQATILNGEEVGVATETQTAAAGVDTWETLTFSSFTPSAKGIITLRLISRSAAGNGIAYFDTVTGGANGSQGLDYFRRGEPLQAAVASAAGGGGVGALIAGGLIVK